MSWRSSTSGPLPSPAELFRRTHERWLSWALRSKRQFPVIPTLRVEQGGFSALLKSPGGRVIADRWWDEVLAHLDGPDS